MTLKKTRILIASVSLAVVIIIALSFGYSSPKVLYMVAEGLDEPSLPFCWITQRIFVLSRNEGEIMRILGELESGENEYLHRLYVRTLGMA